MGKNRGASLPTMGEDITGTTFDAEETNNTEYESFTTENGKHTINVREVTDQREFLQILRENKDKINPKDKWRVEAPTSEKEIQEWIKNHKGVKMYVTSNGTTGAVTPSGDMISLSSSVKGEGSAMFEWQIAHGGIKLDSYDGNYGLYRHLGFVPVSWTPFNKEYADPAWHGSGAGEENIVFMTYGGKGAKSNLSREALERERQQFENTVTPSTDKTGLNDEGETVVTSYGYDEAQSKRDDYIKDNKVLSRLRGG